MKWFNFALVACVIFLSSCGGAIVYSFDKNQGTFEFQTTDADTVIKQDVNFWTTEISPSKEEPVLVNFIYSESTPNVKKLKSISVSLMAKNEKGELKELPSSSELEVSYFDGKDIVKNSFTNNKEALNKLVDWKKVNYTYTFVDKEYTKDNADVTFTYTYKFKTEDYPEQLKLTVIFNWENDERKYETTMTKGEYKGRSLNLKY